MLLYPILCSLYIDDQGPLSPKIADFLVYIKMKVEFVHFQHRLDRYHYLASRFNRFLMGKILDVGCDQAVLKHILPNVNYTGVDVGGKPDIRLDFEMLQQLPFENDTFECVVCLEVLEHLDNLHQIFGELVRVTKSFIIISLPNNWVNARRPIARGKGSIGHYGLPVDVLQDRHKWFFNLSEAINFAEGQQKKHPIFIVEACVTEKPRPLLVRTFRRLFHLSRERYLNRYASTLWIVYRKRTSPSQNGVEISEL